MSTIDTQSIDSKLSQFKIERTSKLLLEALGKLAPKYIPKNDPLEASRITIVTIKQWCAWFEALDSIRDPSEPKKGLSMNIMVPTEAGNGYPSGVSPNVITDPELRRKYEEALLENRNAIIAANLQVRLKQMEDRADDSFEAFIKESLISYPELKTEIQTIIKKSTFTEPRKSKFQKIILTSSE